MAKKVSNHKSQVKMFPSDSGKLTNQGKTSGNIRGFSANRISAMTAVIQKLREEDLRQGHCFMVTDRRLSVDEAYYLYPDGHIKIEQVNLGNIEIPRKIVKVLNRRESEAIKKRHAFLK